MEAPSLFSLSCYAISGDGGIDRFTWAEIQQVYPVISFDRFSHRIGRFEGRRQTAWRANAFR
jgi:hypothetical protein